MKRTKSSGAIVPALMMLLATGCVSVHKVRYKDVPRTNVQFESLTAAGTFYDALLARKFPTSGKPSKLLVGQTLYKEETRPSANVVFNTGIAAADINGDATISESEARSFASHAERLP
jgi:hypothetical protein